MNQMFPKRWLPSSIISCWIDTLCNRKFNTIFQEYGSNVIPDVIAGWQSFVWRRSNIIPKSIWFFCGMHFVVGLADQSETALKTRYYLLFDGGLVGSFAHGGYSKGDRYLQTGKNNTYICADKRMWKIWKNFRFCIFPYTRDWSNISSFYSDSKETISISSSIMVVLPSICMNIVFLSLKVYHDMQVPSYIAGCRALGLVNKYVTGPLWRLLESGIQILDKNTHHQRKETLFSELSDDSTEFLRRNVVFSLILKFQKISYMISWWLHHLNFMIRLNNVWN